MNLFSIGVFHEKNSWARARSGFRKGFRVQIPTPANFESRPAARLSQGINISETLYVCGIMGRTVFISGSFTLHYDGMLRKIEEFERAGFTVLSQRPPVFATPKIEASVLRRQDQTMLRALQRMDGGLTHLEKVGLIERADVFYLYNPDGPITYESGLELGIAIGYGKPIFVERELEDASERGNCPVATMDQITERVFAAKERAIS